MPGPRDEYEEKSLELSESKGLYMVSDAMAEPAEKPIAPTADSGGAGEPPADVDD